jgi:hypothetical protein
MKLLLSEEGPTDMGQVDPLRIDMPSFHAFRQSLHEAAQKAGLQRLH